MLGAGMALPIQSETLASAAVVKPLCVLLNVADPILFQLCLNLRPRLRSEARRLLLIGRLNEAEHMLADFDSTLFPSAKEPIWKPRRSA